MTIVRIMAGLSLAAGLFAGSPASAQFFLKSYDFSSAAVTGVEPEMGMPMPGATPTEVRAGLVWNLRAALNVAALQCQFEPTLLTLDNYNAVLNDHEVELRESYGTLEKYFIRINKIKKVGQTELDKFGTRVYSGFSTVSGQLSFCQTAASIGQEAVFARRGGFGDIAYNRMRELRGSLAAWGEQFRRTGTYSLPAPGLIPAFGNETCWNKQMYQAKRCGSLEVAAR